MDKGSLVNYINEVYNLYKLDLSHLGIVKEDIGGSLGRFSQRERMQKLNTLHSSYGIVTHQISEACGVLSLINSKFNPHEIAEKSSQSEDIVTLFNDNKNFIEFIYRVDKDALSEWVNSKFTQDEFRSARKSGQCNFSLQCEKSDLVNNSTMDMKTFLEINRSITGFRAPLSVEELKKVFAR